MPEMTSSQRTATVRAERIPERFDLATGQLMHFPEPILAEIEAFSAQLDRSVGWCLWMAWCIATLGSHEAPLERVPASRVPDGPKRGASVVLPLGTWRHVTREAERLDRSKSWLLTRAWLLAKPRFADIVAASTV